MPNEEEIIPETIQSTTEKPLTLLRWLRSIQKINAQIAERLDDIEDTLNGKVAKVGDAMTGDLSVPNINVEANANVGKLNSIKLNQKYEEAIKAELHVDEQGIVEFVNAGNVGRFVTTRFIKPSEVYTQIFDNQENKSMSFRLPYLEASAGDHRLLTEEDLGGGDETMVFNGRYVNSALMTSDSYCRLLCKKNLLVIDCKGTFSNNVAGTGYLAVIEMTSEEYNAMLSLAGVTSTIYGNTFVACYVNGGANFGLIYGQVTFSGSSHRVEITIEKYSGDTINTSVSTRFDIDEIIVGRVQ